MFKENITGSAKDIKDFGRFKRKIIKNICKECPTNDFKECEQEYDCWIREAINKGNRGKRNA